METAIPGRPHTLQTARKSKRISQLELALRMGVSQRHVSFVESGRAQPSCELSDAVLAPVREAPGRLLNAHDPMPAMVMDAACRTASRPTSEALGQEAFTPMAPTDGPGTHDPFFHGPR
jgi:transcriptional regulator with XRE-family HTH domain